MMFLITWENIPVIKNYILSVKKVHVPKIYYKHNVYKPHHRLYSMKK